MYSGDCVSRLMRLLRWQISLFLFVFCPTTKSERKKRAPNPSYAHGSWLKYSRHFGIKWGGKRGAGGGGGSIDVSCMRLNNMGFPCTQPTYGPFVNLKISPLKIE
jgi:hypothetical protein